MHIRIITLLLIINLTELINSAEIIRLNVPSRVYEGDSVQLRCVYALTQGERSVYSLKWLLGKREFYRETYREQPNGKLAHQKQVFALRGKFFIDLSNSGNGTVTLRNLTRDASGPYMCEVTTNPAMDTSSQARQISVLVNNNNSSSVAISWISLCLSFGSALILMRDILLARHKRSECATE